VSGDLIVLTLPPERDFHRVVHLVLGGLALRLNLTLEVLEDLQLALDEILDSGASEHEVTVSMSVLPDAIEASVGPFPGQTVRRELERDSEGMSLRRVLDTVVDRVELRERDGSDWVELTKRIESREEGAA
jgi:anti-sigma regulatory factor (Ser/Thr protein kinase)